MVQSSHLVDAVYTHFCECVCQGEETLTGKPVVPRGRHKTTGNTGGTIKLNYNRDIT